MVGSQAALSRSLAQFNTQIDSISSSVSTVKASIGARQNELDNLDAAGLVNNENYTQTINNLLGRNLSDTSELISDLTLKQTYLSAAQKVFVTTSGLTLLNYLK
ncbi:flagellin-like hook-associated protein FlgL [Herbaspirillum rubrisubalbicans]|nr:flagellin-like hook-associated protein FlgL [Herbaspirillum rubrisubalbicans]